MPCFERMPDGFVYLDAAAPLVRIDLRYAGEDNFVGRPLAGYRGKRGILRREAAAALRKASEDMDRMGYQLVVYDAYRPHTAMIDINLWGKDMNDQKMKSRYYPGISKHRIFSDLYLRDFSEHSRGVAVDISLIDKKTNREVDMGGHFDLLAPSSATNYKGITPHQQNNRQLLKQVMERHGFVNYSPEWWHYRLSPEPNIELYFMFPVCDDMK